MTGISRKKAAEVAAQFLGGEVEYAGTYYDTYLVSDQQGRKWKFTYDGSIEAQKKEGGVRVPVDDREYRVEMVTPICQYEDIPIIQELVRQLRHKGAFSNASCGLHVHVSAAPFDARTLRNLTNIMYSKEDILYRALQVEVGRECKYCQKTDPLFLERLNRRRPKSMAELSRIWYRGDARNDHYDESRYHCLNLHSVFQKGTIEFRLFNSTVEHAGKIKAYIQLCLGITAQALNQNSASRLKTVSANEKYTFRTWLLRMGMIGDEFATARKHLLEHLEGDIAWRDPEQAQRQRERMRVMQEPEMEYVTAQDMEQSEDEQEEYGPTLTM